MKKEESKNITIIYRKFREDSYLWMDLPEHSRPLHRNLEFIGGELDESDVRWIMNEWIRKYGFNLTDLNISLKETER